MSRVLRRSVYPIVAVVLASLPVTAGGSVRAADWVPLGGPYEMATPEVRPPGDLLAQVATDGSAYVHTRTGGAWSPPIAIGGLFLSTVAPAAAINEPQKPVELFGVGLDRAMWWRTSTTPWQSLGGLFDFSPKPVVWHGVTYVFGIGLDDAIWYRTLTTPWQSLGGVITSDLTVTTDNTSLWVIGVGRDDAVWTRPLTGSTWGPWQSLGGIATTYPAATFLFDAGYLFIVGADDAVWYTRIKAGQWLGWSSLGGVAVSAPAAAEDPNGGIDMFVVGADGGMWMRRLNAAGWTQWTNLGGLFTSAPGASNSQVFGIGVDGWLYGANYPNS